MSDCLPHELVVEILSRVPVKSLLRFRCVCKSWRSLIGSSNFIRATANNSRKLLLLRYFSPTTNTEEYSLRFDSGSFDEYDSFRCPFESKSLHFRIVGTCNGLVCLCDDNDNRSETIILWNPAIRKFVNLPRASIDVPMVALGFAFDLQSNDFKVVRLACETQLGIATAPLVEVYSFLSDSWKAIANGWDPCYGIVGSLWSQVSLNGTVYWLGYKSADHRKRYHNHVAHIDTASEYFTVHGYQSNADDGFHNVVLSLDLSKEEFRVIEIPEYGSAFPLNFSLGLCESSLALFAYDNRLNCHVIDVFIMKECGLVDSWSRLYKIKMEKGIWAVFGITDGGKMLIATSDHEMVAYDPSNTTDSSTDLGIRGVKASLYGSAYVESLALLDEVYEGLNGRIKSYEIAASEPGVEVKKQLAEWRFNMTYTVLAASLIGLRVRRYY